MAHRVVVLGDSIGVGSWDEEGGWVSRLKKRYNQKVVESSEPIFIINKSFSGATTRDSLKQLDEIGSKFDKETLIIQTGVNDAHYDLERRKHRVELSQRKEILRKLIKGGKRKFQNVVVVGEPHTYVEGTLPWDESLKLEDETVEKFYWEKKETAETRGVPFVDLRAESREQSKDYSYDGVHLNTQGHKLLYEKTVNELDELIL